MSEHHGNGITRRDVLISAAGGLALAAIEPDLAEAEASSALQSLGPSHWPCVRGPGRLGLSSATANPGLAGVLVSNGCDIAVTDPDGRYTPPLSEDATIFVIKPGGLHVPPLEPLDQSAALLSPSGPKGSPAELNLTFEGLAGPDLCRRRSISRFAVRTSRRRSTSCW